jgi:hypothetical protein
MASVSHAPHTAFVPRGEHRVARALESKKKRRRARWKHRHEETRPPFPKVKYKTTYRIKAEDERGRLTFFKVRTKQARMNIKRLLARGGLTERRISI